MASYTDSLNSSVKYICGENNHVCRFCLGSTESEEISLHDFIVLKTSYFNDKVTYLSILQELKVSSEPSLPVGLCPNCASLAVSAFLFQKLCVYSQLQWTTSLSAIDKVSNHSQMLNTRTSCAFFMIGDNENTMLTSYNPITDESKKNVLAKFKKNFNVQMKTLRAEQKMIRDKMSEKRFPCPSCPKIYSKAYKLEDHQEKAHYPKNITCMLCSKKFSTHKQLLRHTKISHIKLDCNVCGLEVASKYLLHLHMDKHYINSCQRCKKQFSSRRSYKSHIKVCGQKNSFICDLCSKVYSQKQGLMLHLKCAHGFGRNLLTCKWCDKKYDTASQLKDHIVKHTRERNFTCEICGGKFVTKPSLVYHKRLHTGERPYACDMCDERFLNASRRLDHKRRVHFRPSFGCNLCPASFKLNSILKKHLKAHANPQSRLNLAMAKDKSCGT